VLNNMSIKETQLREIADSLVDTLGNMTAKEADEQVAENALIIYRELLGLSGNLVATSSGMNSPIDFEERGCSEWCKYKFMEKNKGNKIENL
jgi:hypothetical protein